MVQAIAFDDVKAQRVRFDGYGQDGKRGYTHTQFIGSSDKPGTLLAYLSEHEPGRVTTPHYHLVDEYQIVLSKGVFGRHPIAPYTIHFARAYTPYGPLSGDGVDTFSFFTLRARFSTSSCHLPEAKEALKAVPNRQPWQLSRTVNFAPEPDATDVVLKLVPDMVDERGLAAYTLRMKSGARAAVPERPLSDGHYIVVLKGGLIFEGKEHRATTIVHTKADEIAPPIHAGPQGLEALLLNFPVPIKYQLD